VVRPGSLATHGNSDVAEAREAPRGEVLIDEALLFSSSVAIARVNKEVQA